MTEKDEESEETRKTRIGRCGHDAILSWVSRKPLLKSFLRAFVQAVRDRGVDGELYLVGGSVRDILEGKKNIKDIDLMVSGMSFAETESILTSLKSDRSLQIREVTHAGKHFPVFKIAVRWPYHILPLDMALARSEVSTGLGHRDFEITTGVHAREDSMRRDFTINAIFFLFTLSDDDLSGILVDYQNGIKSLIHREIRAVGVPQDRFTEDPLRMLRAIRQKNERPGFVIESGTWKAICELMPTLILTISAERIAEELIRSLKAAPAQTYRDWRDSGAFRALIPELSSLGADTEDRIITKLEILEREYDKKLLNDIVLVSAILSETALLECDEKIGGCRLCGNHGKRHETPEFYRFYQCRKPDEIARRLALPHLRELSGFISDFIRLVNYGRFRYRHAVAERVLTEYDRPEQLIALYTANQKAHKKEVVDFGELLSSAEKTPHRIDGQALLKQGYPQGPHMSFMLEGVREAELTGGIDNVDEALALAETLYQEYKNQFSTKTGGDGN